ncbi:SDR family NAD(P)-dependent oxidoreductase [Amycolatopsis pithecellobii]|uniref:SDR family NAD(P)-dependent oxidoreductase n=1 Tax=Amycolatopsis pithecellobii TaxID=664692 RepID=A0A6N7Z6I6_9PSEU|nr:SDR family NAD(P)-dependent oxidoreductase [Amycolatopsis pithecellobii]MTD56561.1 SDR family NAD(P)-dependent oxidoreductase [Amycolatopsis pithecellobii]
MDRKLRKSNPVVLVTGSSSGIGAACADRLSRAGCTVYGASRRGHAEGDIRPLVLDVSDDDSVKCAVSTVLKREGHIDVLVNNAGFGLLGAVEETSADEAREQFEVNFLGYHRMTCAVLPSMRQRKSGMIINISSLAGMLGLPFESFYCASKFAVEGWSEALAHEVSSDGIRIAIVQPSDIRTDFPANRRTTAAFGTDPTLKTRASNVMEVVLRDETQGQGPDVVARRVAHIIASPGKKLRYPAGSIAQRGGVALKRWLPEALFLRAIRKYYRVDAAQCQERRSTIAIGR